MNPSEGSHRGIEIRARLLDCKDGGEDLILQAHSDALHFMAEYSGQEWMELLPVVFGDGDGPDLVLECRPVLLPDEYPDPEEGCAPAQVGG